MNTEIQPKFLLVRVLLSHRAQFTQGVPLHQICLVKARILSIQTIIIFWIWIYALPLLQNLPHLRHGGGTLRVIVILDAISRIVTC